LTGNGEWQWSRLVEFGNWKEAYTELTPSWGLDRSFAFSPRWSGSVSYTGAYHFSNADPTANQPTRRWNDRLDNALMLSLMFTPTEQWMIQPFARVMHSAFVRSGGIDPTGIYLAGGSDARRRDLNQSFGLNVMWMPTPRFSVRAFASGEFRNSNDPFVPDYSKFETGLGMSLNIRF
jgi:hypothetical protein